MARHSDDIRADILRCEMAIKCALTDKEPELLVRREAELERIYSKSIADARLCVEMKERELGAANKRLSQAVEQKNIAVNELLDRHLNADQYIAQQRERIKTLNKELSAAAIDTKVEKLAKLEEQIKLLKAEMGVAS
jgi:hypothetical protein